MAKGNFIEYVISDSPTAYPYGGEQDGYWYEKPITLSETGIIFLASDTTGITVPHTLGVKPKFIYMKGGKGYYISRVFYMENLDQFAIAERPRGITVTVNDSTFSISTSYSSYPFAGGAEYEWTIMG